MSLESLAAEYRETGEKCRAAARELRRGEQLPMSETECLILRRRITLVSAMARELIATSNYLAHYYDRKERP